MMFVPSDPLLSSTRPGGPQQQATVAVFGDVIPRILPFARRIEGQTADNINYKDWISDYSFRFMGCMTTTDYYSGSFDGGGNNDNKNNQNSGDDWGSNNYVGIYKRRLVYFKLCPTDNCNACQGGAEYIANLNDFVNAFVDSKLNDEQYNCELTRENCGCQNGNDEQSCEDQCYLQAGLDYCIENFGNEGYDNDGQRQFDIQYAVDCKKLDINEDELTFYYYHNVEVENFQQYNNNFKRGLYVGPYCSANGKKILLGVFEDETCSIMAPEGVYEELSKGEPLPYSKESLVTSSCFSCAEPGKNDEKYYYDEQYDNQVADVCERLYEESGKCESGMNINYPNTQACDFIQTLKKSIGANYEYPDSVFAGLFFVLTLIFGAVTHYLHRKLRRSSVQLSSRGGRVV
mmetsp:Transcript_21370/g.43054  ORF Transcript_21370/g.43054 Transcript_21370/m.43054 type:complete len:403 (-) Transcript_21370:121-1329(-)